MSCGYGSRVALRLPGTTASIPTARFRLGCSISLSLLEQRAQGKPGADCARSTVCNGWTRNAHGFDRYSRDIPAFPAQWLYGLLRALPGERPCLPPLPVPAQAGRIDARVAAPGPHDFAVRRRVFVRCKHLTQQASIATRATLRDDRANVPHGGSGWLAYAPVRHFCKEEFFAERLDAFPLNRRRSAHHARLSRFQGAERRLRHARFKGKRSTKPPGCSGGVLRMRSCNSEKGSFETAYLLRESALKP
jgi:hypothetical protein